SSPHSCTWAGVTRPNLVASCTAAEGSRSAMDFSHPAERAPAPSVPFYVVYLLCQAQLAEPPSGQQGTKCRFPRKIAAIFLGRIPLECGAHRRFFAFSLYAV